jgi:methionine-rich copper-binding protein CopC
MSNSRECALAAGSPGVTLMSKRKSASRIIMLFSVLCAAAALMAGAKADSLKVRDSIPSFDGTLQGREVQYVIRFDGLIDHASSRIDITQSGRLIRSFPVFLGSAPNVLFASGEAPAPGRYILHWEAKSSVDGTVSSGEIPFYIKQ